MTRLVAGHRVEKWIMPVDRAAFLREAKRFILQHCTFEELYCWMTPKYMLETMTAEEILVTVSPEQVSGWLTGGQIAHWIMLQQSIRGVPLEQSVPLLPPKGRDKLRLHLDSPPPPDPHPRA